MFFLDFDNKNNLRRYDMSRFMQWTGECYDPLSSFFMKRILNMGTATHYEVTQEENRADLLSYNIYGDTDYWWILLLFNGILCPFNIPSGTIIKVPSIEEISEIYTSLRSDSIRKYSRE